MAGSAAALIVLRLIPPIVLTLPLFPMVAWLRLSDTHLVLILLYATFFVSLGTIVMRTFMDQVPREMDEAALVDGAGRLQLLTRVIAPLAAPGMVAVAIFVVVFASVLVDEARAAGITGLSLDPRLDVGALARGELHVYGRDETISDLRKRARVPVRGHGTGFGIAIVTAHHRVAVRSAIASPGVVAARNRVADERVVRIGRQLAVPRQRRHQRLSIDLAERGGTQMRGSVREHARHGDLDDGLAVAAPHPLDRAERGPEFVLARAP